ncbi:MAG: hypothetical protein K1060chlam5_00342 [Candidatus Anoxychlamydiales bacterium]|nr:hypothetical protein [Candidatus Anoxychlamydiales bacterium]
MKKYLIAGLIILLPLALTIMIFIFLVDLFTSPFLNVVTSFLTQFKTTIPLLNNPMFATFISRILIIIMLVVFIFILGVITRWFFFKTIMNWTNKILSKIPFVKSIYNSLKDIISSFLSKEGSKAFKHTILIPFPTKDSYCIGFESGDVPQECQEKIDKKLKPVFLPTAPHPISGYMFFVGEDEALDIDIKNEDAVKFTVSCGLILPGEKINDI